MTRRYNAEAKNNGIHKDKTITVKKVTSQEHFDSLIISFNDFLLNKHQTPSWVAVKCHNLAFL